MGTVHEDIYLAQFVLEWEVCQKKAAEKIKTHSLCSITLFPTIILFMG